ncbi:FeoA domain-containing protein [Halarsenatibacter silvermanii]|uniref:FeoA domain-containing protein n=1 Tax=Halarsenatibacter silvermanii TaxID=321763 RepID=A0A1G9IQW4_9FIRM|nr:FeoA domain-containing protein [Halarsenatibacter silvermanii]SDL27416.1 FeoA domain-containing protein [Halarsenatibacter silvermanii]
MAAEYVMSSFVKKIEDMISSKPALGEKYGEFFYGKMIDKEIELADISPGDKVAHLGCGPFPFTAFELAERGWEVTAVDFDEEALNKARDLSQDYGFDGRINFIQGLCQKIDYSCFDAVWVSYNVRPGRECLARIAETIGESGKIIYRQPRGWLKYFDDRIDAEKLFSESDSDRTGRNGHPGDDIQWRSLSVKQKVGKKSVLIEMSADNSDDREEEVLRLEELPEDCSCRVCSVPDNNLLAPLGVRAGKKLRLKTREKFSGPLVVESEDRKVAVPKKLAQNIEVTYDARAE